MHWIYLIHEFHNLSWITEINELFHDILIYWDAPVYLCTLYIPACFRWWGLFFWIITTGSSKHKCLIKMLLSLIDLIPSTALNVPLRRNTWLFGGLQRLVWNKSLAAVCSRNDYRTISAILFVYSLTVSTPLMYHISFYMNIFKSQKCN